MDLNPLDQVVRYAADPGAEVPGSNLAMLVGIRTSIAFSDKLLLGISSPLSIAHLKGYPGNQLARWDVP